MKRQWVLILSTVFFLYSCQSGETTDESAKFLDAETKVEPEMLIAPEVVADIIKSIPSPLEMTAMIKESNAEFSIDRLNNTDNSDLYTSSYSKALNLGVFGADLGYINIYEKTHKAFSYLTAVQTLADDLKVGQFFDFNTIKRLAENNSNLDSVIYISTSGFEKMNTYLSEKERGNISMLILIGGWIEALYIATDVIHSSEGVPNQDLMDRIGEQKITLDDLILLLSNYKSQPNVASLLTDLEGLKHIFDQVKITYTYGEPEAKEVDGMLVIVDNSTSQIEINIEQLKQITEAVNLIRNKIIS